MPLKSQIEAVREQFRAALSNFPSDPREADQVRIRFLGRKGLIARLFEEFAQLPPEQKPVFGKELNLLKKEITDQLQAALQALSQTAQPQARRSVDYTLPGRSFQLGKRHPLTQTLEEVKRIFTQIGFAVAYGPEIDDDFHNFEALNIPEHHPARDMQDTFFIEPKVVLRTHTSNVQIHLMEENDPPIRFIVPGRVYRNEAISFKSYCLFHQVEGLYVDKRVTFTELKGTLTYFIHQMFGPEVQIRFRPSFFPFTEPSAEVDIWNEERRQWMEILGCGMVDPAVFDNVGYDSRIWHGYAFGLGIERIAMLKYHIQDIRLFYQNDLRFLRQF
ncbi:MAG: phenylalanine--tRNA ligase subunit alpha [Candidatus Neomarinimicrobiota bacterium]|nr:MAG: phenylalanine--tRNA ligase subunit alpha [Candidatus Neomarinimicrobiota bacterium]